jgi:uncharacterized protein (TIGR02996 family)
MTDNATDIVALQNALDLDPHDTTTRLVLADALEEQGEEGEAQFHRDLVKVTTGERTIGMVAASWSDQMTRDDLLALAAASREEGLVEITAQLLDSSFIREGDSAFRFFNGYVVTGRLFRLWTRNAEDASYFHQTGSLPCSEGEWAGECDTQSEGRFGYYVVAQNRPEPTEEGWRVAEVTDMDPQVIATDDAGYSVLQGWNAGEAVVRLVY